MRPAAKRHVCRIISICLRSNPIRSDPMLSYGMSWRRWWLQLSLWAKRTPVECFYKYRLPLVFFDFLLFHLLQPQIDDSILSLSPCSMVGFWFGFWSSFVCWWHKLWCGLKATHFMAAHSHSSLSRSEFPRRVVVCCSVAFKALLEQFVSCCKTTNRRQTTNEATVHQWRLTSSHPSWIFTFNLMFWLNHNTVNESQYERDPCLVSVGQIF